MRALTICISFLLFACSLGEAIDNDVKSLLLNMQQEMKKMGTKFDSLTEEFKEMAEKISKMESEQAEFKGKHTRSDDTIQEPIATQLFQKVTQMEADLQSVKNTNTAQDHTISTQASAIKAQQQAIGSVYVRWGHNICPASSDMVYSGYVGGSWHNHNGGASNYLCLPPNPVFDGHTIPASGSAELSGAEYETCGEPTCNTNPVCAVCHTTRAATMMIPGTKTCHPGWHYEYSGYLMTNEEHQALNTEYICVDSHLGHIPGSNSNSNGVYLYYTAYVCSTGGLPCPPYINGKTVLCVVCSK